MSRFAQHTRLVAAPGKRDELVAKFLESAEIQRDNPDCELMLVSTAPDSAEGITVTRRQPELLQPARYRTTSRPLTTGLRPLRTGLLRILYRSSSQASSHG